MGIKVPMLICGFDKDGLRVRQDTLSLKNGVYMLNLNSVLNSSYECNTSHHLKSAGNCHEKGCRGNFVMKASNIYIDGFMGE